MAFLFYLVEAAGNIRSYMYLNITNEGLNWLDSQYCLLEILASLS